jgi:hypothetical protein
MNHPNPVPTRKPRAIIRMIVMTISLLVSLLILLSMAWGTLALWYQLPLSNAWRVAVIIGWGVILLAALILFWRDMPKTGIALGLVTFAVLLVWWSSLKPSNDRLWADDVSRQLSGEVNGDIVTLHNVRNFDWRTTTDYTQRWESRQYDLSKLTSVDMALSYWMGPAIAHTLVSFGFSDGAYVTFSVEIRKEKNEQFSAIGGFFRQFEASVIAADESDILRVRTNVRGEDVYLYNVAMPDHARRSLFLSYINEAHLLQTTPRFYNTLTANCTTIVFDMVKHIIPGLPMDYRLLASGYLPAYLYDINALNQDYSLANLQLLGRITERAKTTSVEDNFSQKIRAGIPVQTQ